MIDPVLPRRCTGEYRLAPRLSGVLVPQGSLRCSRRVFLSLLRQLKRCRQEAAVVGRYLPAQRRFRAEACRERPSITATQSLGALPGCTMACAGRAAPAASSCPVSRQALCKASGGPHGEPEVLWFLMPELQETSPFRVPSSATTATCTSVTPYLAFRPWIQSFLSVVFIECLVLPVCVVFLSLQENHLCTQAVHGQCLGLWMDT